MAITDEEVNNPNVRRFLDFIASAEGTKKHGYNTQVGNTRFEDLKDHPRKTTVVTEDGPSSAAGRYQFVKGTWDDQAKKHGLTDFSPANQDRAAVGLLKDSGAYDDVANGNYGPAINRLGGVWASMPSSKYKQPKKSWEWAKSELEGQGINPERDYNNSVVQKGGLTPSEHIAKEAERDKKRKEVGVIKSVVNDIGVGFSTSLTNDNTGYNWYTKQAWENDADPDFKWTPELSEKYTAGISDKYWDYVWSGATSEAHAAKLQANAKEYEQTEKRYQEAGFSAGVSRMVGGIADPTNIAIVGLTAFAPELGLPMAATRWGRIAYGAAEGAITNVAQELILQDLRPEGTNATELVFAAAMGTALGGVGGQINHSLTTSRYNKELETVQAWGRKELNAISASDFAALRIGIEKRNGAKYTPEELKVKEAEFMSDFYRRAAPERPEDLGPQPRKNTWDKEWDTPTIIESGHKDGPQLHLPPNQPLESLIDYIRLYSPNKANVAWMDQMLEGINIKNILFYETGTGKQPDWYVKSPLGGGNLAHIGTPIGSRGTKEGTVEFAIRGLGRDGKRPKRGSREVLATGMTDGTFVHELAHVAGVYKQRLVPSAKDKAWSKKTGISLDNIEGTPKVAKAVKELDDLYKYVLKVAKKAGVDKSHYGLTNAYEFLAEGISNPKFQKFLQSISLEGSGLKPVGALTDFFNKIMDLLGIDKKHSTAFHKFMEVAEPVVEGGGIYRKGEVVSPPEGYRVAPDSKATHETAVAADSAQIPEVWGWGIGLENRLNRKSLPDKVKELAQNLFGTTIGYKDHSVVKSNAWDDAVMFREGWNAQLRKTTYGPFLKWMKEQDYKFTERGDAFDDFGEQISNYIRGFPGEFHPEVKKAGDAVRKNLADRVEDINNPNRTGSGWKKGLTEKEVYDEQGNVIGFVGKLEQNENYLPRVHDSNKWGDMVAKHGRDKVEAYWAAAYKSGRDDVTDKQAAQFAKWYTRTVEQAQNQAARGNLTDMLRGQDRPGLIESLKTQLGIDEDSAAKMADQILGYPSGKDDSGRIVANLKHRNTIDERFIGPAGSDIEGMKLNDFIKTNALEVVESYNNRVAGNVALAKNLDVYKSGDVTQMISDAVTNTLGSKYLESDLVRARDDLQFAFDRILSVPLEEGFNPWRKGLSMVRNFNVMRLMSGAVFNQLTETAQIAGTVGYKAMIEAVPDFGKLMRDMETGKAPTDLLDHLENTFGGAGAQYIMRMDFSKRTGWSDNYRDGSNWNKNLDKLDGAISYGAQKTLDWTGMTGMLVQQTRLHATALVNGFVDLAHGVPHGGGAFLTKERLAWMGLSEDDFGAIKNVLKDLSSDTAGDIRTSTKAIDWDKFSVDHPELHHKFMRAIWRESRRVIQENDLGSMVPFMGTTLGKTAFQFMNFGIQAWNKQLMFGAHHRDAATLNGVLQGTMYGSVIYAGRAYQNSIGMEEEARQEFLAERLGSPHKVVLRGWARTGASSMIPNLATLVGVDWFQGSRTTTDLSGLMSNPTYAFANSIITSGKKVGTNALSSETQTTQADVKAMSKLLPFHNLTGVNTIVNKLVQDFPTEKAQE